MPVDARAPYPHDPDSLADLGEPAAAAGPLADEREPAPFRRSPGLLAVLAVVAGLVCGLVVPGPADAGTAQDARPQAAAAPSARPPVEAGSATSGRLTGTPVGPAAPPAAHSSHPAPQVPLTGGTASAPPATRTPAPAGTAPATATPRPRPSAVTALLGGPTSPFAGVAPAASPTAVRPTAGPASATAPASSRPVVPSAAASSAPVARPAPTTRAAAALVPDPLPPRPGSARLTTARHRPPPAYRPTRRLPSGSGTGRRIVYAERSAHVWIVDAHGAVVRDYPVTGRIGRPRPAVYHVYSMSRTAVNPGEKLRFDLMVRFAYGVTGARIGFHTIPRTYAGVPIQGENQLGQAIGAGGCVRQRRVDAEFLYSWVRIGDTVVVLA
ncbi:MAG: hypothetical protein GC157_02035 [Frankiales bacterium]|nr:hypothetical protein [Frankiales bacterium]